MKNKMLLLLSISISQVTFGMEGPKVADVKESKVYPKLIMFDFHGTLSLEHGKDGINDLKARLKKYMHPNEFKVPFSSENWLMLMQRAAAHHDLKAEDMMPTLDDVVTFIANIETRTHNKTLFAIGSSLEQDSFMVAMLEYCFGARGMRKQNPFNENTVIGTKGLLKYGNRQEPGKLRHLAVILANFGLQLGKDINYPDMILIDNSEDDLAKVRDQSVKTIKVDHYFRIKDWNKQYKE